MTSKKRPYGVLFVTGLKTHQENYAPLFAADPRCRLVAVTDEVDIPSRRRGLNCQLASELYLPYIEDLSEALARDDIDIVSVCAEHERRGRVAVQCAQAGKHLYLDKPMTCSIADADAVVSAVRSTGVHSQVFSFIHNPWVRDAKKAVESGAVGKITAIHCDVMFAKGYAGTASLGKPRRENPHPQNFTFIDSKRELHTTGVYAIGAIRWLTGLEVQKVFCVTANYFFAEHMKNDVEDFSVLDMELEGGITTTIACGRTGWMSHKAGGLIRIRVVGTKGSLTADAGKPGIEVCMDKPSWTPPPIDPEDPMSFWSSTQKNADAESKDSWVTIPRSDEPVNDASRFVDCIEADRESEMSALDGAAVVEVLMAGYLSAGKSEVVTLPLPR